MIVVSYEQMFVLEGSLLPTERIILGIDPGLANTGWGVVHQSGARLQCLAYGCVITAAFATGQARGAALAACGSGPIEVGEFSPRQIKLAVVGTGSADKAQVQYMVKQVLSLEKPPEPDHAADALAAAICFSTHAFDASGYTERTA